MRLLSLFCLSFLLIGISAAQDTNFPAGPQYLLTGSPLLARPVATPSMSLDTPLPPVQSFPEEEQTISVESAVTSSEPSAQINPEPSLQVNLLPIFYGYSAPGTIELASSELPSELPESITDGGVTSLISVQSLLQQGYGIPLGDTAAFWKAHKPHAPRVFTNADVERLHGS